MKLRNVLVIMLLLSGTVAFAQQSRWPAKLRVKGQTEWMKENLHLTAAQEAKVSPLVYEYEQNMDKACETPETRVKAQARLMRKKDMDMKEILNADQYQKWLANEIQNRQRANVAYNENRTQSTF